MHNYETALHQQDEHAEHADDEVELGKPEGMLV